MKKVILALIIFILGVGVGHYTTIENSKVDILEETETGAIVGIDSYCQTYTYYVEK